MKKFEFGIYSLADIGIDPLTGKIPSPSQRLEEILQMADLTENLGLDVFAQPDIGGQPFELVKNNMNLFANEVVPIVRNHIEMKL